MQYIYIYVYIHIYIYINTLSYIYIYILYAVYINVLAHHKDVTKRNRQREREIYRERERQRLITLNRFPQFGRPRRLNKGAVLLMLFFRLVAKPGCWEIGFRHISWNI